jgi:hypothetical protein
MWRWIIRVWVSIVLFVFLMSCSGALLIRVTRLLVWVGLPLLSQLVHSHVLFTMFLLGVLAGQVVLGSNFTGRGWFRSKSGHTYEGFKLEKIKLWTWLTITPVLLLGIVLWFMEQSELGVTTSITLASFYHDFLMPNCSTASWRDYRLNPSCGVEIIFVGSWTASIGYSLAPLIRRGGTHLLRSMRSANKTTIPDEKRPTRLMKEKTDTP